MARYWIITVSEENWEVIRDKKIYGAPESKRFKSVYELVKPGDYLLFYTKRRGSRRLGERFVGVFRVASEWFRGEEPLLPDEVREGRVKYPWRVRLEPVKLGEADFRELVPKLKFIGNKKRPNAYLVGTPANLRRPIPEEDAETIMEALR